MGLSLNKLKARFVQHRRDEDGAMIVFTLFVLVLMLVGSGMAVDFLRFSAQAARLQDTADRAAVAATNLTNDLDPRQVVERYFEAAGLEDRIVSIDIEDTGDFRRVEIDYDYGVNTYFLRAVGLPTLAGENVSAVVQGVANVEISLVLDISASMFGEKIETLREEAVIFAQDVLDPQYGGTVSMNVVPFAGDLDIGEHMFDFLDGTETPYYFMDVSDKVVGSRSDDELQDIYQALLVDQNIAESTELTPQQRQDLFAATEALDVNIIYYPRNESHCLVQTVEQLENVDLPERNLPKVPHFHPHSLAITRNAPWWCPVDATVRYAEQVAGDEGTDGTLSNFLANIPLGLGTNSATALNYGAALLNPTTRNAYDYLIDQNVVTSEFRGRPANYEAPGVQKILIFMSDGNPWEVGYPTRPWERWNLGINGYGGRTNNSGVLQQNARHTTTRTTGQSGTDMDNQCKQIVETFPELEVITLAFDVSEGSTTAIRMANCASQANNAYIAEQDDLGTVFNAIAQQISELRIEQ